ncbi:MAG: hypothetical protein KBE53_02015, partial [Chromatiaceae bacterium]|nr:hypothetical protein [Chromatiaceae bacterium]
MRLSTLDLHPRRHSHPLPHLDPHPHPAAWTPSARRHHPGHLDPNPAAWTSPPLAPWTLAAP